MGTVVVAGVAQLVPVHGTSTGAPPLTLTRNDRLPSTVYRTVSCRVPALAAVTLTLTALATLPMNRTFAPPEHVAHAVAAACPVKVLPVASASTVVVAVPLQVICGLAQSAWSELMPSPPSVTTSTSVVPPVTSAVTRFAPWLPVTYPLSATFLPSSQTWNTTWPVATSSSTPTSAVNVVHRPARE